MKKPDRLSPDVARTARERGVWMVRCVFCRHVSHLRLRPTTQVFEWRCRCGQGFLSMKGL